MLTLPKGEVLCLGQVSHDVAAVLFEYLPCTQFVQVSFPMMPLNLPAAQARHDCPLGPVKPSLQTQSVM